MNSLPNGETLAKLNSQGVSCKTLARQYDMTKGQVSGLIFRYKHGIDKSNTSAKILLWDVETTPIQALVWGLWDQNVNLDGIQQDSHLLSWSAKWLFNSEIMFDVLTPEEAVKHDDKRITKSLWKLLDEADIVIGHNTQSFDEKTANRAFLKHGLLPTSYYQSIDTLQVARSAFRFSSNKLDGINQFLGLPRKIPTDFNLWVRCFNGEPEALQEMLTYNKEDTEILEDLYLKLRPWIKGHPNLNLWSEEAVSLCPNCGTADITWKGHYHTYTGLYKSFRCNGCGAIGRSRYQDVSKEKRKSIVR